MDRRSQSPLKNCCDDKMETPEVQAEELVPEKSWRMLDRSPGQTFLESQSTGFSAQERNMMKNKANGPVDCLVTEMLQC